MHSPGVLADGETGWEPTMAALHYPAPHMPVCLTCDLLHFLAANTNVRRHARKIARTSLSMPLARTHPLPSLLRWLPRLCSPQPRTQCHVYKQPQSSLRQGRHAPLLTTTI
jgi:hypothetical protein